MRSDHDESLPDEASIYRKIMISDGQGGEVEAEGSPELIATWDARLSPMGSETERVYASQLGTHAGWILTLPFGAEFEMGDTIEFLFKETFTTKSLEIIGVKDPRTHQIGTRLVVMEVG